MSCTDSPLACALQRNTYELQRIADALQPNWDWTSFWTTFIATLAGVVITGALAYLLLRREIREQYATRIDDALARLLYACSDEYRDLEALNTPRQEGEGASETQERGEPAATELSLNPHGVLTALLATRLIARGTDLEVIKALQLILHDYYRSGVQERMLLLQELEVSVTQWRSGEMTKREVIKRSEDVRDSMEELLRPAPTEQKK